MYNNLKNSLGFRLFSSALNVMFANELTLKAKNYYRIVLQSGRSMIEMLGVLAIIAVLSVGGIAGYSKAMEKWKINRAAEDFNYMIYGLIEHLDDLRRIKLANGWIPIADYVSGLNLVPKSWKKIEFPALTSDQTLSGFQDTYNNYIFLLLHSNGNFVQIETRIGGQTTTGSGQISEAFSSNIV